MEIKRLTLSEYRKINAVWLSNDTDIKNFQNKFNLEDDNEVKELYHTINDAVLMNYYNYLGIYGIDLNKFNKIPVIYYSLDFDTTLDEISNKIESIINEIETEHCHH